MNPMITQMAGAGAAYVGDIMARGVRSANRDRRRYSMYGAMRDDRIGQLSRDPAPTFEEMRLRNEREAERTRGWGNSVADTKLAERKRNYMARRNGTAVDRTLPSQRPRYSYSDYAQPQQTASRRATPAPSRPTSSAKASSSKPEPKTKSTPKQQSAPSSKRSGGFSSYANVAADPGRQKARAMRGWSVRPSGGGSSSSSSSSSRSQQASSKPAPPTRDYGSGPLGQMMRSRQEPPSSAETQRYVRDARSKRRREQENQQFKRQIQDSMRNQTTRRTY